MPRATSISGYEIRLHSFWRSAGKFLLGEVQNCDVVQPLCIALAALSHSYNVLGQDGAGSSRVIVGRPSTLAALNSTPILLFGCASKSRLDTPRLVKAQFAIHSISGDSQLSNEG